MSCSIHRFSSFAFKLFPVKGKLHLVLEVFRNQNVTTIRRSYSCGQPPEKRQRFWINKYDVASSFPLDLMTPDSIIRDIRQLIESNAIQIPKTEAGFLFVPKLNLMVPTQNAILQTQHATIDSSFGGGSDLASVDSKSVNLIVCGYSPRAHEVTSTPEEQLTREVDSHRVDAINLALRKITDVTGDDLLSERYAGTPPARIYRAYVTPRPTGKYKLESAERSAERTALQIELALRQVRADEARYIRNNDKSLHLKPSITQIRESHPIVLVLDNIRSAFNVGSMFRSAETAGLSEIVTCGITAHPPHPKLKKTALSAMESVPSRHFEDAIQAIKQLKDEGYHIITMETTTKSVNYTDIQYQRDSRLAIVMGNELTGVDPRIIDLSDFIVEIPTYGIKNSLNVASAASIMMFEILRQWQEKAFISGNGSAERIG